MASAVQSLRLSLRRAATATRPSAAPVKFVSSRPHLAVRPFSSTPLRNQPARDEEDDDDIDEDGDLEMPDDDGAHLTTREMDDLMKATRTGERVSTNLRKIINQTPPLTRKQRATFWNDEEEDPDLLVAEEDPDDFNEDDITSLAHGKFEEFREYREYARIAAWQMPLLSKLATPFEAPSAQQPLRFRYTTYMGETHPAEQKVVVEFSPQDMPLNEAQQQKLRKLLGARWNPETDIAKMSCEQFDHPAQNKRYLSDLVNKLVTEAKDGKDTFEDVPLDTRHHKFKVQHKFPKEWRMTEERKKFIEDSRQQALLLDEGKAKAGKLIDGKEKIEAHFGSGYGPNDPRQRVPEYLRPKLGSAPRSATARLPNF
ncbi:mitochondrial ribosomal subunit protein-domain-containing protein [Xylariaceae sp. FL1019]|nr:mitochondrial ribosomal subunit protein-domain-containing protein [Xylariaceae sp. FL1019]